MVSKIGEKIQRLRKEHGLTQAQLATRVNVSPQAVSKWENGDAMPDVAMLGILAQIFEVSTDYLILNDATNENREEDNITCDDADSTEVVQDEVIEPVEDVAAVESGDSESDTVAEGNDSPDTSATARDNSGTSETSTDVYRVFTKEERKEAKHNLDRTKTLKWTAYFAPIVWATLLLGVYIAALAIGYVPMKENIGAVPALSTAIVVSVVAGLLLINYVLFRVAMTYRKFLGNTKPYKYPKNGAEWIGGAIKRAVAWLLRYLIAVKLFYDENKAMKREIEVLDNVLVEIDKHI